MPICSRNFKGTRQENANANRQRTATFGCSLVSFLDCSIAFFICHESFLVCSFAHDSLTRCQNLTQLTEEHAKKHGNGQRRTAIFGCSLLVSFVYCSIAFTERDFSTAFSASVRLSTTTARRRAITINQRLMSADLLP